MSTDFAKLMSEKSDEGLQKYLDNTAKFVPESTEAAIAEFQKRGRKFSEEELSLYTTAIAKQRTALENEDAEFWQDNMNKENIVTDANAPLFYSKRVIFVFTFAFGVLFGAVLLAMNIRRVNSSKGIVPTVAFGVAYTVLQIGLVIYTGDKSNLSLVSNSGGAIVLHYFFWKKYIGVDTTYKVRSFVVPLIVGIIMSAAFIILAIAGQ